MNTIQAIIISIVEGLTEFLPVSSTGHMIITQGILGIKSDEFIKLFTVCIQFGAILSVLVMYWKRFFQTWEFYWKLLVAFIPAAIIGFLAGDLIDSFLENVWVVSIMLVVGGVFMLFVDKWFNNPAKDQTITYKKSFMIGLAQCVAMIPGVSRSMATIVGGMTQKLTQNSSRVFIFPCSADHGSRFGIQTSQSLYLRKRNAIVERQFGNAFDRKPCCICCCHFSNQVFYQLSYKVWI